MKITRIKPSLALIVDETAGKDATSDPDVIANEIVGVLNSLAFGLERDGVDSDVVADGVNRWLKDEARRAGEKGGAA